FGNRYTVLCGGGCLLYEQLALDVFNCIANSFGLRATPTGALLCSGGATGSCKPGPGTIPVINISYSGTNVLSNGTTQGGIPFNWSNNSASVPLYSFVAACGDGTTTGPQLPAGFTPSPCNAMLVDPNLRTPYVADWSLDIQSSLSAHLSLDIGYVGNHGTKLISALDINQPQTVTANVPGVGVTTFGAGFLPTSAL